MRRTKAVGVKEPANLGSCEPNPELDEWADFVCGRVQLTARRQSELQSLLKDRFGLHGIALSVFDRELIRRSRTHYGSRDLPRGTRYELDEVQRTLLAACVARICPGGDLGEWSIGTFLDHPDTIALNHSIAKETVHQKCPHCRSRNGAHKSIFPTREVAEAWAHAHLPPQFAYLCEHGQGWHVSSQVRTRDAAKERRHYEQSLPRRQVQVDSRKVQPSTANLQCQMCQSLLKGESAVHRTQMELKFAIARAEASGEKVSVFVCAAEDGWHIRSAS